jgi:hypothetical protein
LNLKFESSATLVFAVLELEVVLFQSILFDWIEEAEKNNLYTSRLQVYLFVTIQLVLRTRDFATKKEATNSSILHFMHINFLQSNRSYAKLNCKASDFNVAPS